MYKGSNDVFLFSSELCGTPGYLAPEILKCSMDEMHAGYGKEVDLWVSPLVSVIHTRIQLQSIRWSVALTFFFLILACFDACVVKLGVWSDPLHLTCRLTTVLASQTDADAEDDHGGSLSVQLPRVGWQVRHCQRPGKINFPKSLNCNNIMFSFTLL